MTYRNKTASYCTLTSKTPRRSLTYCISVWHIINLHVCNLFMYRDLYLIDTASVYKNEADIGRCLKLLLPKYNLKRSDIFITSKLGKLLYFTVLLYGYMIQLQLLCSTSRFGFVWIHPFDNYVTHTFWSWSLALISKLRKVIGSRFTRARLPGQMT